jgi:chemotaxis protein methyltransferase CheR
MAGDIDFNREFHFTPQDFDKVRRLIYNYAGISLNDSKQDMVYGRLAKRLRAHNFKSFSEYIALLERGNDAEFEAFVNALTTNLTAFFREDHHFPALLHHLRQHRLYGQLNIWCCASSTGEEPYSLAMTACEAFDTLNPPVKIIATDIDTTVLNTAQAGIYPAERVEKLNSLRTNRFFVKTPGKPDHYTVRPELKSLVTFRRINLIDNNWPIRGPFDAIFCRNVMIYFDRATQLRILQKFVPLMRPDGELFVGHSENLYHATDLFTLKGKTIYGLTKK